MSIYVYFNLVKLIIMASLSQMMTLTSLISLVQSDLGEEELQMRTGTVNLKMTYLEKICCLAKRISRICQMKS